MNANGCLLAAAAAPAPLILRAADPAALAESIRCLTEER